jgi:hypothetical protein
MVVHSARFIVCTGHDVASDSLHGENQLFRMEHVGDFSAGIRRISELHRFVQG